jgi:hypothetical protein
LPIALLSGGHHVVATGPGLSGMVIVGDRPCFALTFLRPPLIPPHFRRW